MKNVFRILSGNDMVGFLSKNAFFNEINKAFLVMQAQLSFTASLVTLKFNVIRAWGAERAEFPPTRINIDLGDKGEQTF